VRSNAVLQTKAGLGREVGQSLVVLALTGASVGCFLGMVAVATRALGG
jgi:hypothetical protein